MNVIKKATYTNNQTVHLDFNEFIDCEFRECELVFHGYGPVSFIGCQFYGVSWLMADAALMTMKLLQGMYHGAGDGGREMIENTFENIRQGRYDQ